MTNIQHDAFFLKHYKRTKQLLYTAIKSMVVWGVALSPIYPLLQSHAASAAQWRKGSVDQKQAMRQSQTAHQALKKSLLKQLAVIKAREEALQHATTQATQTENQLRILKTREESIQRAIAKTQETLNLINKQRQELQNAEIALYQEKVNQALKASLLLPSASYLHDNIDMPLFWPPPPLNALPSHALSGAPTAEETTLALSLLHAEAVFAQQQAARLETAHQTLVTHLEELKKNELHTEQEKNIKIAEKIKNDILTEKINTIHQQAEQTLQDAQKFLAEAKRNTAALSEEIAHLAYQETTTSNELTEKAKKLAHTNPQNEEVKRLSQQINSLHNGTGLGWGHGATPVDGTLFTKWGEKTENGDTATGLTYKAAPHAAVYAPCNGHLLYTGQFRSFGQMIILDCGHKERFVLSGLGKITSQTGQAVKWGETLGTMPEEGGLLFLQLHHDKYLLDPTPYLESPKESKNVSQEKIP